MVMQRSIGLRGGVSFLFTALPTVVVASSGLATGLGYVSKAAFGWCAFASGAVVLNNFLDQFQPITEAIRKCSAEPEQELSLLQSNEQASLNTNKRHICTLIVRGLSIALAVGAGVSFALDDVSATTGAWISCCAVEFLLADICDYYQPIKKLCSWMSNQEVVSVANGESPPPPELASLPY